MAAPAAPDEVAELTGREGEVVFPEGAMTRAPTETVVSEECRARMLAELGELPELYARFLELHHAHPRTYKTARQAAAALLKPGDRGSTIFTHVDLAAWKALMLATRGMHFSPTGVIYGNNLRVRSDGKSCRESSEGRTTRLLLLLVLLDPQHLVFAEDKQRLCVDRNACARAEEVAAALRDGILARLQERLREVEIVVVG